MRSYQVQPLQVRVDLGVMVMKVYSTFKSSRTQASSPDIVLCLLRTLILFQLKTKPHVIEISFIFLYFVSIILTNEEEVHWCSGLVCLSLMAYQPL